MLFSSQREYARTGDKNLGELLVQLLVDRTKVRNRNLTQIVLNESLAVAPKLPSDQLDALSLTFLFKYTISRGLNSLDYLQWYLDNYILPFVPGASKKQSAYQHLEFASCGNVSVGSVELEEAIREKYMGLFSEGFTEEELQAVELTPEARTQLVVPCLHDNSLLQVNALDDNDIDSKCEQLNIEPDKAQKLNQLQVSKAMPNDKLRDYLIGIRPQMAHLFEVWNDTPMKYMTLTSVGIAIAHANVKKQTGETFDLSIWI